MQEYMGYCMIPTTKAQKMLMLIGKGGEGKSRIGLVMRSLLGINMNTTSIQKVEKNDFARADLEDRLRPSCCVCLEEGQPDMTRVGQFLQIHTPEITMNDYLAGVTDLPTLLTTKEGMQLVQ